ncbi:MAG: hypothetical protein RSA66_07885 [Muribaculaceae bacterium]
MDKYSKIAGLLRSITGTDRAKFGFWLMEVMSVDGDMCTAKLDMFEVPDIRLSTIKGGSEKGLLITPAVGSIVMVADLSCGELRELAVIGFTEVVSIDAKIGSSKVHIADGIVKLNDGNNDGLVNVRNLTSKLNVIEQDINNLKTVFGSWVTVPQDGGAALKAAAATWAGKQVKTTTQSDIEDTKVTH